MDGKLKDLLQEIQDVKRTEGRKQETWQRLEGRVSKNRKRRSS